MRTAKEVIQTHPGETAVDLAILTDCVDALYEAAQHCTTCADACLAENDRDRLVHCIRMNLDCADICETSGRLLSRQTSPDWGLLRAQIEVCVAACRSCAAECERHANTHEHCRVCAEACRRCEEACTQLLAATLASPPHMSVDTMSEQSFPASDPPPGTGTLGPSR